MKIPPTLELLNQICSGAEISSGPHCLVLLAKISVSYMALILGLAIQSQKSFPSI